MCALRGCFDFKSSKRGLLVAIPRGFEEPALLVGLFRPYPPVQSVLVCLCVLMWQKASLKTIVGSAYSLYREVLYKIDFFVIFDKGQLTQQKVNPRFI